MNRKALAVAVSSALAAPMAAQALDGKVSGQVNRSILWQTDGEGSSVNFVDSISSGSRFRITASEDIGNGMKAGTAFEFQFTSNPSSATPIKPDGDFGDNGFQARQVNVWFSGNFGKVTLGHTNGAGDGGTEAGDFSGTAIANSNTVASWGGGVGWRTSNGAQFGSLVSNTVAALDGFSRYDVIRYDTPALGPVVISASLGNKSRWESKAVASGGVGGGEYSAALFYSDSTARNESKRWGGSAGFLAPQGTNIYFTYAHNNPEANNDSSEDFWYVKLGQKWGNNAVSVGYGEGEDFVDDTTHHAINLGFVHTIPKPKVELYAGYTYHGLDVDVAGAPDIQEVHAIQLGSRIKF